MTASTLSQEQLNALHNAATDLRIESVRSTSAAGSGHPTSCCSAADIVAALFFSIMRYDPKNPKAPNSDRFVLSKGHAAPLLYAAWAEAGLFPKQDLLKLRTLGSDLEGHPTPRLPFVDMATGSLGQGLPVGVGLALNAKHVDKVDYRTYVLMGDGESVEGSNWEAVEIAHQKQLDNLCADGIDKLDIEWYRAPPRGLVFRASDYAADYGEDMVTALSAGQDTLQPLPDALVQGEFYAQDKPIAFKNGHGVRYLTQILIDFGAINNEGLFYYYQGITADGEHFLSAIFPVNADFLPANGLPDAVTPPDGVPFDWQGNNLDFPPYLSAVTQKLNDTPAERYTPSLLTLDRLIESIQVSDP